MQKSNIQENGIDYKGCFQSDINYIPGQEINHLYLTPEEIQNYFNTGRKKTGKEDATTKAFYNLLHTNLVDNYDKSFINSYTNLNFRKTDTNFNDLSGYNYQGGDDNNRDNIFTGKLGYRSSHKLLNFMMKYCQYHGYLYVGTGKQFYDHDDNRKKFYHKFLFYCTNFYGQISKVDDSLCQQDCTVFGPAEDVTYQYNYNSKSLCPVGGINFAIYSTGYTLNHSRRNG